LALKGLRSFVSQNLFPEDISVEYTPLRNSIYSNNGVCGNETEDDKNKFGNRIDAAESFFP